MAGPEPSRAARLLVRWVTGAGRHWRLVLAGVAAATVLAAWAVVSGLGIHTNLDEMLSPELPFRRSNARFVAEFPQNADRLVAVVDAETPEDARGAALAFAAALRGRPDRFSFVDVPMAEPFLERHAFLYLDEEELDDLAERLAQAQPFLGRLARDPSLRGLLDMLERVLEEREKGGEFDAGPLLRRLVASFEATAAGRSVRLSWARLMEGDEEDDESTARQVVIASLTKEAGALLPAARGIAEARRLFDEVRVRHPGSPRLRLTGSLAMEHEEMGTVMQGAEWISLASFVLVGAVTAFGLRSWRLLLPSLALLVVGLVWTAAFAALAVGHLNLISVAFAILFIGLAVDYAIHFVLRFREAVRAGRSLPEALAETASDTGGSLLLCALTTVFGFYAFVPTAYRGVSELGLIAGTGILLGLFLALTLLPALLAAWPYQPPPFAGPDAAGRLVRRLAGVPGRHRRAILVGSAALAVGAAALIPQVAFDLNPLNLRNPESESVSTFRDLLATSEVPPWSVTVLARGADAVGPTVAALRANDAVDKVVHLGSYVPADQDAKLERIADLALAVGPGLLDRGTAAPPTPEDRQAAVASLADALASYLATPAGRDDAEARALALASDRLLSRVRAHDAAVSLEALERDVVSTLPGNLDRLAAALETGGVRTEDLPEELVRRWVSPSGLHRVEAFPRENLDGVPALRRFVAAVRSVAPDATGAPVMIVESGHAIVASFQQAVALSVGLSVLLLFAMLRRPRDVLLALVPLLFAALLTGAATVVFDLPFNFANVIALPLLFGVGVDSGIHMVHRARAGAGGGNPMQSSTGRAVVFSALTTVVSFVNLAFSPHPGTASLGAVLGLGISITLLATVLLLPALLAGRAPPPARTGA